MLIHMTILALCIVFWPDEPLNKRPPEEKKPSINREIWP